MDFVEVLGSVLNQGMSPSSGKRLDHSLNQGSGLDLGGLLESLGGQGGRGGKGGLGGLVDSLGGSGLGDVLGNFGGLGNAAMRSGKGGASNPVVTGGLGALAGALLGGGGSSMKGALGGTALAILGSMAMKALAARGGTPSEREQVMSGLRPARDAEEIRDVQKSAELTVRAMINAAKADGQGDREEIRRIIGKASEDGLTAEEQAFVSEEIHKPMETAAIVREVPNAQVAAQVYAASLLAIEVDTDAERNYLEGLALALDLDREVVDNLHAALGVS